MREAEHPNLVKHLDTYILEDKVRLVTELVDGQAIGEVVFALAHKKKRLE